MKKSEKRQMEILEYMKKTIKEKGYSPTVREICEALDVKSTSTVHTDIKALELKGLVHKDPSKPRTVLPVGVNTSPEPVQERIDDFNTVSLPVIGRVAAGTPILSESNIEDTMPMPSRFIGPGNNFILTVHGDSMINVGINDGDYLIVQEDHNAYNGEIVVAMINGEYESEATVKRFYKENGHIRLQPENDTMDPIIVDDCTIIGKVKGVFRYYN
ncbi:MAG: transcriptional repressor LexA [Clostridiales bacterium]|nr:transcriptional repressor LexA [Candidatus Crickella merdequi]